MTEKEAETALEKVGILGNDLKVILSECCKDKNHCEACIEKEIGKWLFEKQIEIKNSELASAFKSLQEVIKKILNEKNIKPSNNGIGDR